jgi:ribosomal protein S18 acetylase RimI-like enzyme
MNEAIAYREGHDVDLDQLERLITAAGWGPRERSVLAQQVEGARFVVSAWSGALLVGFARGISDGIRNGYVSTVVVDEVHRGRGIGHELVRRLVTGRDGIRWVLHARPEVKGFYEKLGFTDAPDMLWRDRR